MRPEQISQPTQNTAVPAPQVIAPYASELDGGADYTTGGAQIQNEVAMPAPVKRRHELLTTAYRSHLWGLIWTVIILILLALLAGLGMKLVGKYRKAPTITNSDGLTSVSAPTGLLGNQLLTVNGQLKVTGLTTLQSGLKVTGPTNLQDDVSVGGNLNVAKNAAVTGTLTAGGLRVLGGVSAPTFQGGNFTGGAVNVTTINAAGTISGGSFTGNGTGLTGVNATLLNGQQGSYYLNASNISGGVLGIQYGGTGATTSAGARANLGAAAAGANNDITSLSGLTTALSASQGGTGVDGSTAGPGQILIGNGSGYSLANLTQGSGISITNASGSITIGVDSTVCTTAGNCGTGSGGGITGSGSADTIAMFTGAGSTLGNSLLSQSGSTVSVLGNLSASGSFTATSGTFSGAVSAGSVSTTGAVTAASANVSGNVTAGSFTGNGAGVANVNAALLNGQAGSYYTNASNLSTGTVADARLSTNVTLQGNTFNGPNQLVQLTATGALPALDGSNVSNVNAASLQGYAASYFTDASNLSSGTLADARLSSNVPLKNTNNTFTGSNTFAGVAATSVSAVSILQNGNTVCDMSGNCAGVGGGVTTSGGTAGVLPVFTGAGSIANSLVSQAGSTVTVAGTLVATALQGSGAGLTSLNGSNIASGTVAVSYGGTGATSFTTNGIIYGNGTGSLQTTAAGTSGQCLVATTGSAPSWQSCSAAAGTPSALAGDVTGPLSSNTVSNLQGSTLTLTTPAAGNFLLFDGAAWVNQSISGDATVSSGGALTVANSAITSAKILDATITAADIAAGTITGSNIASGSVTGSNIAGSTITGSNIAAGTVANGNLVNSSLTVTAGTGLTGGGSVALGGSTTLQVSYGNTAGTAVAGNTTLICPSGTGNLTGGGNTITLGSGGTCNNLSVVASPSFTGLTISSFSAGIITADASGNLSSGSLDRNSSLLTGQTNVANGGTGAATAAGARTNLGAAASGANSDITSLSAVTSIGSTGSALTLQGNASTILSATDSGFTTSVGFAAPTANVNYIFPVAAAGTYDICTTAGNCAGAGGGISGSGTNNTIAMFTGSGTIGNSILSQSGTTVTVAGTLAATTLQGSGSGITNLNGTNITSGTVGVSVGGTGSTTFTQYGVVYGNGTGALQATVAGTTGQCLVATTSAAPSWVDCVTAASGATPGGPAGGDLSGTYPNPTVSGLAGTALSVGVLSGGDILIYNGTNWVNAALSGDITVDSAGISTIAAGTVTGAKIAAGTITGSNIASGTIANSNLVNSGLTITAGTGLTGGGAVSLGGSTTLNVNFGSTAGTAVAGNTTLTCPTGTGNLTGGGTVITLGAGGVCGSLSTVASPTFTGLTLSSLSTGAVLSDASGNLTYGTIDLGSSSYVSGTLSLTNGGTGATTAAGARTNLGAAASGANSDITSLSGLTTMLSAGQGGTGVDGATAANGQLLIGNGSGYTLANLTQGSNIAITNAAGSITIGLTGTVPVTNGGTGAGAFTANGLVYGNGTGALQATAAGTTGQCLIATTGSAPTWGSCSGSAGVTTSSSGTANTIAMFTGTNTIANSIMTQSGSTISVAGTLAATTLQGDGALVTNVDAVSLGGQAPSYYTNASNLSAGVVPTGRISGTYSGLTGTGALTSGSIGTGFGAISTGSAISTTAALQGNTLSIGSGTFTVDATGAITAATGITSSGTVTLSSLGTGVVKATGGVLSTGTVTLGTDTSGAYVAALGTLTGLTTTGNSGAGSTPSLSVTYGAAAGTAAQGNTALSFTGSGNLTGTVSGTAGGGFSTNTLAIVNNPTFSGLLTANGGVAATTGTFSGAVTLSSLGAGIVQTNASGVVSSATIDRNSALLTGQTSVANGGTGASTASGARTNLGAAASGANTDITSLANATSVGSTGAALTLQGNASTVLSATDSGFTTSVGFAVPTANVSYLFDTAAAGTYNICTTAGNCAGTGGGVTTSGGTNGTIAMFTGSQTIANSILSQSGSTVTVAGTLAATTLQGSGSGITNLNGTNITSGTVGVSVGGTGTTTFTQYGVVYGNGTGALQATVAGTTGQCLVATTGSAPSWQSCSGAAGTGGTSMGGDVTGTVSANTVSLLQGQTLTLSTAAAGNLLVYNGSAWVNQSMSGDLTVTGAGVATIANGAVTGTKIAAGTVTGSNIASSTVTNANLVNSSLTVNAGTGLTGGGSVALGGSITLNVAYGSTATTAVAGNTTLTCPTGTGNLTGGGNTITLGSGGTCGSLSTVASPTFSGLTLSGLTTAGIVVNDASGNLSTVTSLPVANGGTGTTSVGSAGSITYSNGTSLAFSAVGGTGQCLMSGGTGAPTWGACATGGAGSYIQNGLTNQTNANFNITSNAATNVTGVVRAFAGQTADLLQFQNSSATPVSGVDANGNWYIANSGYKQTLQSATLTANQTITMPNASGTVITTGNLTSITAVGTVTSGTWNGSTVGTVYGGTGATSFASNGVLYGNGSGAILATAAGTTGQCLVATTGSAPSWQSCAAASGSLGGDVTGSLSANTISKLQNTTVTISSLTSGNFLQYNGTAWVNQSISGDATVSSTGALTVAAGAITGSKIASGTITNTNLASGNFGNITGVGTLGSLTVSGATSTGALTASSMRDTALGVGAVLSDASGNLTSGTINLGSSSYVSGTLAVTNGGTGATTAAGARTNLGAAASGANSDITSLSGLTTALSVGQGGTGVSSVGSAGSIAYSTGTAYAFSAAGTSGQCLTSGGSGAPSWTTCTGAGSGNTLQTAYANSLGGTTPEIVLDNTRTTVDIQAYSGQTADLLNLRAYSAVGLGSVLFGVSNTGAVTLAGGLTVTGGGAAITGNSTISGTLTGLTGLASSGTVQFSALGTGVVLSNGSGQLSNGTVNLASGSYVSGTLGVANGGTGLTSAGTAGTLVYSNGSAFANTAQGTSGQCLISNGSGAPTWTSCASAAGVGSYINNQTTNQTSANFNVTSGATTSVTGTIRALASQTADLLQFQSSAGAAFSGVNTAGNWYYANSGFTSTTQSAALTANRTITLPDATGTVITTGNLSSITATGTITSGAWNGTTVGIAYGGTGNTAYTTNGVNFYDGTKIASTAAGTTGQCLVATTGSAPTWQSCSTAAGTPTTLAGDVTGALGSNTVSKLQNQTLTLGAAVTGNFLQYNGTAWVNQSLSGDLTVTGAGVATIAAGAVTGTKIANNTITNANLVSGSYGNITAVGTLTSLTVSGAASTGALTASSIRDTGLTTAGVVTTDASGNLSSTATVPVANGGTGATTAAGARTNLQAAASGANSDITSLSGLTIALSVGQGGTGATSVGGAGSIAYSTGTAYAFSAAGTAGQCLTSGGTGAPTWTTCTGAGSGNTLQTAYANSLGGTTPEIVLDNTRTTVDIQAYSGQTADLLNLRAYSAAGLGSVLFGVSNTGAVSMAGQLTVSSGGAAITGNTTISGTLTGLTGVTSSGTIQFSGLATGVVLSSSGTLSSGTINLASSTYVSGTLPVANGGTGLTSAGTAGTLLYSNGTSFLNSAAGTSGQCLTSGGSGAPTWANCATAAGVGSYINNGTTNQAAANFNITSAATSSVTAAIRAIASQSADLMQFQNSAGTAVSGVDNSGNWYYANSGFKTTLATAALTGNQAITLPNATGTVITTGNLNGITATGTITSGTWNGSTVGVPYGGTGATTLTLNGVLYGNGTGAIGATGAGTTGQCLVATTGAAPSWGSCSGSSSVSTSTAGTANTIAMFTGSSTIANSLLTQDAGATTVTVGGNLAVASGNTLTLAGLGSGILTSTSGTVGVTSSVPVANGGTGATTAAGARTNLQAAASGANSDITSLSGLTTALSVGQGGTGVTAVGAAGSIAYSNGTTYAFSAAGTSGQCLVSAGSGSPTWAACAAATGGTGYIQNTTTTQTSANFNIQSTATTSVTGAFRAIASQTADLIQFQTSAGVATGGHNSAGNLYYTNSGFSNVLQSAALTANRTITMPNASGTLAVSASGNIALDAAGNITFTGQLPVANGGTGSSTAAGARTNLGAAASGANSDITSLSGLSTALSVGQGGTGATTFTANGVVYGNGTSALASTAAGTTGQCLIATTGSAPTWGNCTAGAGGTTMGGDVTGTVAANTISKLQNTTVTISSLTSGNFLQYNGTAWVNQSLSGDLTVTGAGVATIANGVVTGAKIANGTITNTNLASGSFTNITGVGTLGSLTVSGATTLSGLSTAGIVTNTAGGVLGTVSSVPVANGGTGTTSAGSAGSLVYSNGSAHAFSAVGTSGQCLVSGGTGAPTWTSCSSAAGVGSYINNATTLQTSANFNIQSTATTSITGVIRQLASQTADLLQFQSSTGVATSGVNSAGNYYLANSGFTDVLQSATLTANRTVTLPDASGTLITTGNLTNITATGTITSGTWNGTAVGATYGGTGLTSYTTGDLLYANSSTTLARLADVASGQCLVSGGVGVAPAWGNCTAGAGGTTMGGDVTGTVAANTLSNIQGTQLTVASLISGNMLMYNGTRWVNQSLSGDVTATGAGVATIANGVVTSAKIANNTITNTNLASGSFGNITGVGTLGTLTVSGAASTGALTASSITNSALSTAGIVTNTAGGVLGTVSSVPVANGGTNATSIGTAGSVAYSTGTAYAFSAAGTSGQCLTSGGTGAPTWTTCTGAGSGNSLQTAYGNSVGGTTPEITLDGTRTTLDIQAYSGQTANLLNLRAYSAVGLGSVLFGVSNTGAVTLAGGLTVTGGGAAITGNSTISGTLTGLTGLASSGTVQFSALGTGVVLSNGSGQLSSGTINLASSSYVSGTLAVANGGTGLTSAGTAGTLVYSNGSAFANTAQGTSGQCLISNGSGAPTWTSCASAAGVGSYINNQTTNQTSANFNIQTGAVGNVTGTIRALASQTADLLQFQTSAGAAFSGVNNAGNWYYANSGFKSTLQTAALTGNQTITLPNATGTVITTGNLSSITATGTITSGAWNGTTVGIAYGGTGNTAYTTNGVNFYDGTKIASTAAGTTGQCLVGTTGSAPTWQSCSTAAGTPTTLAGDVTGALGSNTVSKLQGNVLTTTATMAAGQTGRVLQWNGSAWVDALVTNSNLSSGSYGNITGVGTLGTLTVSGAASTGALTASSIRDTGLTTAGVVTTDASGNLSSTATVPVANGGTGATTAAGARTNLQAAASGANSDITSLSGLTTALSVGQGGTGVTAVGSAGTIAYSNGTTYAFSAAGSAGQCLVSGGSGAPTWTTCAAATGATGYIQNATATQSSANFNIQSAATTSITGVFRAIASQTADLVQFQTSAGAATGGHNSAGNLYYTNAGFTNTLQSAALTASRTITMPNASGTIAVSASGNIALSAAGNITFTGQLPVANGGTGSGTAAGARTNLGAAASGANSDITSLSGLSTALSVGQGGTGATTFTANGVVYGNGASALASTAAGTTGQCLVATTSAAPSWQSCSTAAGTPTTLGGDVTGSLSSNTLSKIQNTTLTISSLTSGNFLMYNGTNWVNQSVSGDATVSGTGALTVANGAITGAKIANNTIANGNLAAGSFTNITGVGTLTAGTWNAGVIGAQYGGTGISSYTIGDLLYASGATSIGKLAAVAAGQCLLSNGVGAAPAWGTCPMTGANTTLSNLAATNINQALNTTSGNLNLTTTTSGNIVLNSAGTIELQDNTNVTGTLNATTGIQLNGTDINTAGTLTNVAYLNQANTFTAAQTVQLNSTSALLLNNALGNSIVRVDTTNKVLQLGAANLATTVIRFNTSVNAFNSTLGLVAPTVGNQTFNLPDMAAAGTYTLLTSQTAATSFIQNQHTAAQSTSQFWLSGDGRTNTSFTTPLLQSAAGAALSVDSGTTGALNIGTGANAKTITVGNTTSGTSTKLQAGATSITTTNSGVIVSATAAQSSAFQIQNASSAAIFNVDTTNSAIDITGSLALKRGSDFTTTGTSNDVNFGNVSLVRLNGSSAQTITGIANGRDGYMLTIVNAANQTATIANSSTSSVAANRIITGTGANVGLVPGASAQLVYDSGSNMWRIVGAVTSNGVPAVRAYSTTSTILTAASGTYYAVPFNTEFIDTDVMHDNVTDNTRFYAKTAGVYKISATIRYASNGMGGATGVYTRLVINDVGVLALTGDGASSTSLRTSTATVMKYLNVGDYIVVHAYQDTGANMNVIGGTEDATSFDMYRIDGGLDNSSTMGGVTTVGTLDGGTRNATGASIASNNFYLQSAGTDYAGLVNTTAQTFGGVKTFNNGLVSTSLTTPTVQSAAGTALLVDSGTTGALNIGTSANAKTITIGNNTGATALNLVAGTGNVNITGTLVTGSQAADPTGVAGAMYYNSTTGTFRCYQAGTWQNCMGALYTTAADSTALNGGTTGAQFFSTAYSMPANYCTQGRAIHLSVGGVTTSTTTAQAMRFAVYVGGTQIGQAAATYTPTASQTNAAWFMDYTFTCRAAPSAASAIYGQGTVATQLTPTTAAVTNHIVPSNFAGVNVATNAAANIQIAVTYTGTANAANTVTLKQLVINSY